MKNEIVIQDACILFDLVDLGLLDGFFQLDLIVITTPQVVAEVTNEEQWKNVNYYVENEKLRIDRLGTIESIAEIDDANPGLSFADSSVIESATRNNAIILSSDGSLRKVSETHGLTVHGVLWIVEQVFEWGVLSADRAIQVLNDYLTINKRAPKKEVNELLQKIANKTIL